MICWISAYGIGPTPSYAGVPSASSAAMPGSASAGSPAHSVMVATTIRPRSSVGTHGAGGAVMKANPPQSSLGADSITSPKIDSSSAPRSAG